jgi:hypothetical protein
MFPLDVLPNRDAGEIGHNGSGYDCDWMECMVNIH